LTFVGHLLDEEREEREDEGGGARLVIKEMADGGDKKDPFILRK
jgi:hypothetical protein